MKLFLSANKKALFNANNEVLIERILPIPAPRTSIVHGVGKNVLFDKIEYRWVYGDTADYKEKMKNVDRRADDYSNNCGNTWNGSYWWDCERDENPYNAIGEPI